MTLLGAGSRRDAEVEAPLDQPYRGDRGDAARAEAESEARIQPGTARQISHRQERRDNRRLSRLDTQVEADEGHGERGTRQSEISQYIGKPQSMHEAEYERHNPQPLFNQGIEVVQRGEDHRGGD